MQFLIEIEAYFELRWIAFSDENCVCHDWLPEYYYSPLDCKELVIEIILDLNLNITIYLKSWKIIHTSLLFESFLCESFTWSSMCNCLFKMSGWSEFQTKHQVSVWNDFFPYDRVFDKKFAKIKLL